MKMRKAKPSPEEKASLRMPPGGLADAFVAPRWLREAGGSAWLLVGLTLLLVGAVWLASLTYTIVGPLIAATVVAAVAAPVVRWLQRHRIPRGAGAALILLAMIALVVLIAVVVMAGIASESAALSGHLTEAKNTLEGWVKALGVDDATAQSVKKDLSTSVTKGAGTLLTGVGTGLRGVSSLAIFVALTALSLFFLLKDGPTIRAWGERHLGLPAPVARMVTTRGLESLQGYFLGLTIVGVFNAVVVGLGALALGVPLPAALALITFLASYIPYFGAFTAGLFSILIALGGAGIDAAVGMAVVQLLANTVLQQLAQPLAFGAALGIHPLAVLVTTIAGGALFGSVGLILGPPLTSAAVRISSDLARARAGSETTAGGSAEGAAAPSPRAADTTPGPSG
jgi:predicted PurR-regulated permease PerM